MSKSNINFLFVHVFREANHVADWLANLAHSYPIGVHTLDDALAGCAGLLENDCRGVFIPRSVLG